MKRPNGLKFLSTFVLIGTVFVLFSCKTDDIQNYTSTNKKYKLTKLKQKEILSNPDIISELNRFSFKKMNNQNARIIHIDSLNFTINTEVATLIEGADNYKSYSFFINRDSVIDNKIENLVLIKNDTNTYKSYIVKYDFTIEEFRSKEQNIFENSNNTITPLEFDFSVFNSNEIDKVVYAGEYIYIDCETEEWHWINIRGDGYYTYTDCTIYSVGGGGNGGSSQNSDYFPGNYDPQTNTYYDPRSGGNGDGSYNSNQTNYTFSPTVPDPENWELIDFCLNNPNNPNYTPQMLDWLKRHNAVAEQMNNFLQENYGCNDINKSILIDAIKALMEDVNLTFSDFLENYNCIKLNEILDPDGANITNSLQYLKDDISLTGEDGVQFQIDASGNFTNPIITSTTDNMIDISVKKTIGGINVVYGAGHNHPMDTFPAPSWSDVNTAKELYHFAENNVRGLSTLILVSKNCIPCLSDVYAIKVDNYHLIKTKINNDLQHIHEKHNRGNNISMKIRVKLLNDDLQDKYIKNPESSIQTFINEFSDYGITLYKANSTLDGWSKLTVNALGSIDETPCN